MIVIKVGGSLFDHPNLGPCLREWMQSLPAEPILVPGGGPAADLVRQWDATHGLGEEAAHWLALRAMSFNARLLATMLDPESKIVDPYAYLRDDEESADRLPHAWSVTSDSVAARVAVKERVAVLILLKSAPPPPGPWIDWQAAGYVDEWFPKVLDGSTLAVQAVNFREVME